MPEPKELQRYLCPTCRIRYYTRNDVKLTREQRVRQEGDKGQSPLTKKVIENFGKVPVEKTVSIERRSNPYKIFSLFGIDLERRQLLNTPVTASPMECEHSAAYKSALQSLKDQVHEYQKWMLLLIAVMQIASLKYPNLEKWEELFRDFGLGLQILNKINSSAIDDRHKKTWYEWLHIIKYAEEVSAEAASQKFHWITDQGKKAYLSPKYIKAKRKEVLQFAVEYPKRLARFFYSVSAINCVISGNPELMQEYERLARYENEELWEKITQDWNDEDRTEDSGIQRQHYSYMYYKIRHYDHELYEKRKLECKNGTRKSIGDARTECRVRESELPPEVISYIKSKSPLSEHYTSIAH